MAKTYSRLNIDVNGNILSCVTGVQMDLESRYLDVSLFSNSTAIDLTGQTVRMLVKKPPESGGDGTISYIQGEITDAVNGRCQFELTNQILAVVGAVIMQIEIWNGTSVLSTHQFNFYVLPTLRNDEEIESTNEYGALVVLFQEIQDALDTMHKIAAAFGEPGDKAAEYGVDTFWGILETLAQRGDVESALQNKIKAYLNSTVGTSGFQPLDKIISELWGGVAEYATAGTYQFKVPKNVHSIKVTACGGGGAGSAALLSSSCGGGGGSGGAAIQRNFTVTPLSTINITVGSGGVGTNTVVPSTAAAARGEATVVGTLVTLVGGYGGYGNGNSSGDTSAGGASAGEGSGAGGTGNKYKSSSSNTDGSNGLFGKGGAKGEYSGGGGGSIGNGGAGATYNTEAGNGVKGGGGGGAYKSGGSDATSSKAGNGGDGYVKIEWGLTAV